MDKRKVIAAYVRGMITVRECAQILGVDLVHVERVVTAPQRVTVTQKSASSS